MLFCHITIYLFFWSRSKQYRNAALAPPAFVIVHIILWVDLSQVFSAGIFWTVTCRLLVLKDSPCLCVHFGFFNLQLVTHGQFSPQRSKEQMFEPPYFKCLVSHAWCSTWSYAVRSINKIFLRKKKYTENSPEKWDSQFRPDQRGPISLMWA